MKIKEFNIKILSAILIFTLVAGSILGGTLVLTTKVNAAERELAQVARNVGKNLKAEQNENTKLIKKIKREGKGLEGFTPLESPISLNNQKIIYKTAKKYKLDYMLVAALVETESGGNCKSVSSTGDYGMMQINQCNHTWLRNKLDINDFLNPKDNAKAGCYLLASLLKRYDGNKSMALMAYNMGEGNAAAYWKEGIFQSDYSKKILNREKELMQAKKLQY